jgi:multicomponent Na+:H+ antiporter subunit B
MRFPFGSAVLDGASRLLTPFILLFAVYAVAHGHDSPGGGFQGGVLLAAGLLLVKLVRGRPAAWGMSQRQALAMACLGLALFAGIGLIDVALGGSYLDYDTPAWLANPVSERLFWTFGVEVSVALAVTGVILLVFHALAGWGEETEADAE